MAGELADQVAIVTGAGRGIGRAVAQALAGAGAAVTVAARRTHEVAETVALTEQAGGRALALTTDVTDQGQVERMVKEAEERLGPVDLLVNNAGVLTAIGPIWEVDPAAWWCNFEVNVLGTMLCARAALPGMIGRERGRIINVASPSARMGIPAFTGYSVSKIAVVRFTEALALEAREHGISVFAINPGWVYTEMVNYFWDSPEGQKWFPWVPARYAEINTPPECPAAVCLFLATGQADALTGRYLTVDEDEAETARHAGEVARDNLHVLRLQTWAERQQISR